MRLTGESGSPSLDIVNRDPVLHNIHSYELIDRSRRTLNGGADHHKRVGFGAAHPDARQDR